VAAAVGGLGKLEAHPFDVPLHLWAATVVDDHAEPRMVELEDDEIITCEEQLQEKVPGAQQGTQLGQRQPAQHHAQSGAGAGDLQLEVLELAGDAANPALHGRRRIP